MSKTYVAASLRRLVEERTQGKCEYCLQPESVAFFSHEVDHVIAEKYGDRCRNSQEAFYGHLEQAVMCWQGINTQVITVSYVVWRPAFFLASFNCD